MSATPSSSLVLPVVEDVVAMATLICIATGSVYVGATRLIRRVLDTPEETMDESESMTVKQAAVFPLQASALLVSVYVLVRFVSKSLMSTVAAVYLTAMSAYLVRCALVDIMGRRSRAVAMGCVALAALYLYTRAWFLNNLLAVALAIISIENVDLGSFRVAVVLLLGLFVYDILWVFGSDVMVTVALALDGPVKLDVPRRFLTGVVASGRRYMSLGLGDIVIPGFYMSLIRLFSRVGSTEAVRARKSGALRSSVVPAVPHHRDLVPTGSDFYFTVALVAYVLSLMQTMMMMFFFQHSQPALLYIVPWLVLTTVASAWVKGDVGLLWTWSSSAYTTSRHADKAPEISGLPDSALLIRRVMMPAEDASWGGWWAPVVDGVRELWGNGPSRDEGTCVTDRRDRTNGCVYRTVTAVESKKKA